MAGMNGLFMINDPGVESSVQVLSRVITFNGGSTGSNVRYMDILSNGDSVPSSIITTTASTARRAMSLNAAFSEELQRAVVWYNLFPTIENNKISYSNDLGLTWQSGVFNSRQGRGGLWCSGMQKWVGFGLTGSSSPFTGQMHNSDDGITFTLRQSFSGNIYFTWGAYSPQQNIAVAANAGTATKNCCYWTTDSVNWYAGTFSGTSFNPGEAPVIYQGFYNTWLVGRNGSTTANYFARSTDGKNWDPITATGLGMAPTGWGPYALAHNPVTGRTILGKFSGANQTNAIAYSDNGGFNWTEIALSNNVWWLETAKYDVNTDMFIIGMRYSGSGQQGVLMSSNGINWTYYPQTNMGAVGTFFPVR